MKTETVVDAPHPCYGKSELFDSIYPMEHLEAAALCATCPALEWCKQETVRVRSIRYADQRPVLTGTWAGRLWNGMAGAGDVLREEVQFDDEEARACNAAYEAGDRHPRVKLGNRVYFRRASYRSARRRALWNGDAA